MNQEIKDWLHEVVALLGLGPRTLLIVSVVGAVVSVVGSVVAFLYSKNAGGLKDWVHELLKTRPEAKGGVFQLRDRKSEYWIPDSDNNRNIFRSDAQPYFSYALVRVSFIFQAHGSWTAHGCLVFLREDDDWHRVTLFTPPGDLSWPFTGPTIKGILCNEANSVSQPPKTINETKFSLGAEESKELQLTGWLRTKRSLSRETRYPALMLWHINTVYAASLIHLHERDQPDLLGHRLFKDAGGFPADLAKAWASSLLLEKRAAEPGRIILKGI